MVEALILFTSAVIYIQQGELLLTGTNTATYTRTLTHTLTHIYLLATVWHQFSQILICASCTLGQGDFTLISLHHHYHHHHHHHLSRSSISAQCYIHYALGMGRNPSGFVSSLFVSFVIVSEWLMYKVKCVQACTWKTHVHRPHYSLSHIHTFKLK